MQLDFKMFWLIVRYRWIEIQRQGNSWVLFFLFFFVRTKLVLLVVAACLLLSGYFGAPPLCLLSTGSALLFFSCHHFTWMHSFTRPATRRSAWLTRARFLTHLLTGCCQGGVQLAYSNRLGRAWLYMSGMNRAGSYRVMKICPQHLFLGTEEGDEGIGGSWRWGEEVTNRRAQCHPTALWRAREDLKLINMRCSGYIGIYRRARCKIWPRCLFCKWIELWHCIFFIHLS